MHYVDYAIVVIGERAVPSDWYSLSNTIRQGYELANGKSFIVCQIIDNEGMDWVDLENPIFTSISK